MRPDRFTLALCWLLVPVFLAACERPTPPTEVRAKLAAIEHPNIVLVLVDTLRADWTTPYGYERDTTPELQRWAERGALFERARAQSSWTKVSMASLFTSLWPRSHGVRHPTDGLGANAQTLAGVLKEAGYHTYGVQSNGWLDQSFGFQQGFDRYVFPKANKPVGGLGKASHWPHANESTKRCNA